MALVEFLRLGSDESQYLYYTGPLENWAPTGLDADARWHIFDLKDKVRLRGPPKPPCLMHVRGD